MSCRILYSRIRSGITHNVVLFGWLVGNDQLFFLKNFPKTFGSFIFYHYLCITKKKDIMKYGNFVGKGWLPIEQKEADKIRKHLKKQLVKTFGKDFFTQVRADIDNDGMVKKLIVRAYLKTPFNGRNMFGSTVKNVTDIWFFITKDKAGYLEIHDPDDPYNVEKYKRDYKNCPEFSWGCNMNVTGSERRYQCKHWESIQNWSPYIYGTEIKDLTYDSKDMEGLKKALTQKPDWMSAECLAKKRCW